MDAKTRYSKLIKSRAYRLGFLDCGIAKASFLEREADQLRQWLSEYRHGRMQYMEHYVEKRTDPAQLVPQARSVISVLLNYYPRQLQRLDSYNISKYAYGRDYHMVMKSMLKALMSDIRNDFTDVNGRVFVDTAPVMDKVWAQRAGLGWIGKNTNLVSSRYGSFFFIGELIIDQELAYDEPAKDYCGNCRKCIDACPTGALTGPYQIDASRCISYLTIENKDKIPATFKGQYDNWIFGCDICQDVCPWNAKAQPTSHEVFLPPSELLSFSRTDWAHLTREQYQSMFQHSAVKRAKYEGLMRNIRFLKDQKHYDGA
jgi:epoxyqueuosine reductase